MHKPCTTYYRMIDWLLVLAIALAPLQYAFSAYGDTCTHEFELATTDTGRHAAAGDVDSHDHSGTGSAHDCCQHGSNCTDCAVGCNLVNFSPFVSPSILMPFSNSYNIYESQYMTFYIGRVVPTLFRPPRTSV